MFLNALDGSKKMLLPAQLVEYIKNTVLQMINDRNEGYLWLNPFMGILH